MKKNKYKSRVSLLLFLALLLGSTTSFGQADKRKVEFSKASLGFDPESGIVLMTSDTFFSIQFRFRMQNRLSVKRTETTVYDAEIRNLRLRLDGHVVSPKLSYKLQVSLAPDDLKPVKPGENTNIIRDLILQYQFNKNWSLLFGHTKLPGNRQQLTSSGNLQLTDRSINNSRFRLESDMGLHLNYKDIAKESFSYSVKSAISTGKSNYKTSPSSDNSFSFTGKLELYPLGDFSDSGASFEGDLAREPKPKLLVSGAFHHTNAALRSQGLKGTSLYEARDIQSVFVDLLFKYKGWAAMLAYLNRSTDKPMTQSSLDPSLYAFVFTGYGIDYQLSYLFANNYEITGRFSDQQVQNILYQNNFPDTRQWSLGVTKYIWHHKIKLQAQGNFQKQRYLLKGSDENWSASLQIEFGI